MSNISGIGGGFCSPLMQGMQSMKRPDPAAMADKLFSKIDSSGQGYFDKTDLKAAFDKVSSASDSGSTSSVDQLFSKLDGNGDGKVSKEEFSDTLKKVADELSNQFMSMRMSMGGGMHGSAGGRPDGVGGPPGDSAGFSKDELSNRLGAIASSNSPLASALSGIVENFETADSDGDGKVSYKEAAAYRQQNSSASELQGAADISAGNSPDMANIKVMQQILQLVRAYGIGGEMGNTAMSASVSISA